MTSLLASLTRFGAASGAASLAALRTIHPSLCASGVPTANTTYLVQIGKLAQAKTITTARWYNNATISGNIFVSVWTSPDGATWTQLASTGAVAQSGANAVQDAALVATIPAGVFVAIGSGGSSTGTVLVKSGWPGALANTERAISSFNAAGTATWSALTAAAVTMYAEVF